MKEINYILVFTLWITGAFSVLADSFVLVIDPGHGGKDAGAVGKRGKEKDVNLAVGTLLGQYIAAAHSDVKIAYTRSRDVFIGLNERADIANKANANLFISIHTNAVAKKANVKGAEVFTFGVTRNAESLEVAKRENEVILLEDNYQQKYEGFDPKSSESYIIFEFMVNLYADQSINFASKVQKELVKTAKRGNRGVKQAGYLVLRKSSMPRILIELDFISNAEAENYLLSQAGQRTLAQSICNAFTEYKKEFDSKGGSSNSTPPVMQAAVTTPDVKPANGQNPQSVNPASSGTIYKIQILASSKELSDKSPELKGYKPDYYMEGNLYKYTYGESSNRNEIENLRKIIAKDFKGAFIVAFEAGVRVPNK